MLAGAEPVFLNTTAGNRFQPDLDAVPAEIWKRCEMLFLCSPGNPTGAVLSLDFLRHALELAEKHDFVIAVGRVLRRAVSRRERAAALAAAGRHRQWPRCVRALHGVPLAVQALERARTALRLRRRRSGHHQALSSVPHLSRLRDAGADAAREHRGLERRRARRRQPRAVSREVRARAADPRAGARRGASRTARFYLWPDVQRDDETFTRDLFATQNLTILPGSYLARDTRAGNPGDSACASRWSRRWTNV